MSTAAAAGRGSRFVRDENGKLVRNNDNNAGGDVGVVSKRGGRGGGGGRGGTGGGMGGMGGGSISPSRITSMISRARCPHEILSVVKGNLHELNHIHIGSAFNKLRKTAKSRDSSLRRLVTEKVYQELLHLARDFAKNGRLDAQSLSNTTHGIAKLHEAGQLGGLDGVVGDTLAALESDAVRVAPDMKPQEVANTVWAYAKLGRMPGDKTWVALEAAAMRVTPNMNPQDVADTVLGYAKLEILPGEETRGTLEAAAVRVAPAMIPQGMVNTVWGYAKLGRMPGEETWGALEAAAVRVAPGMNSQYVANTVWGYATLSTLQGVNLPSCYAVVWDVLCGVKARHFSDEGLSMIFHVHLMHEYLLADTIRSVKLALPAWLMTNARDAWMKHGDNKVSRAQRELAHVFDELGVPYEVERVTDDGYFSMDIYLPEYDACVEFDGPSHYYNNNMNGDSSFTFRNPSWKRNAKTKLRDLFLAKQCAKVVTVPCFEFDKVKNSPEMRRLYVKEKVIDACAGGMR